ncbi:hypothetical protein GCK72_017046 [Caenorhabditis remanei]|uniref:Uncharacterized protein n=1 Tax=Caenorhabditis remanei TaxID=31234 RepID=A0A6A5G6L8_CAERE|nr:hypothetical protein GCK72_017046 [Caenorhabditis remanei]KAF1750496.1 hypothetical protein GCK72_017046 [Caenorhabditis remanei]
MKLYTFIMKKLLHPEPSIFQSSMTSFCILHQSRTILVSIVAFPPESIDRRRRFAASANPSHPILIAAFSSNYPSRAIQISVAVVVVLLFANPEPSILQSSNFPVQSSRTIRISIVVVVVLLLFTNPEPSNY